MRTGSWVIVRTATGEVVFETFSPLVAAAVNRDRYTVLTAYEYLTDFNRRLLKGTP